jgi:Zinc finger, C2H2 type
MQNLIFVAFSLDGTKTYMCNKCNKTYLHKGSLPRHTKVHPTGKCHTCPICDGCFYQAGNLRVHKETRNMGVSVQVRVVDYLSGGNMVVTRIATTQHHWGIVYRTLSVVQLV